MVRRDARRLGASRGPSRAASARDQPRDDRAPHRRLAHTADPPAEPLHRSLVAQHRHRGEPDGEEQHGQSAEQRRHQTSTLVVRRMSTNAIVHRISATTSPAIPSAEDVMSWVTPGDDAVDQQDRGAADPGHDVGREDDAAEQRVDLAPQVLAGLERGRQLAERAHGVAAGALLDRDRRHQHRDLARRQAVAQRLERVLDRPADLDLVHHPLELCAGRIGQLARGHPDRLLHREPRRRAVGEHPRHLGQLRDERVAPVAAAALDQRARDQHGRRRGDDERDGPGQEDAEHDPAREPCGQHEPEVLDGRDLHARAGEPGAQALAAPRPPQARVERAHEAAPAAFDAHRPPARGQLRAPAAAGQQLPDPDQAEHPGGRQQQERVPGRVHSTSPPPAARRRPRRRTLPAPAGPPASAAVRSGPAAGGAPRAR